MISPELLRRFPFFAGLSEEQLKQIAMIAEQETYKAGEVIFEEGDEAHALYIIVEGEVSIVINIDEEGEKREELSALHAGEIMAWSAIVPPHTLTASGVASATPTRVIAIDGAGLRALFEADCGGLGYMMLNRLLGVIRERMSNTRVQLVSLMGC